MEEHAEFITPCRHCGQQLSVSDPPHQALCGHTLPVLRSSALRNVLSRKATCRARPMADAALPAEAASAHAHVDDAGMRSASARPRPNGIAQSSLSRWWVRSCATPYGTKTTLVFPGAMGGGNWGGVSFNPTLGYVFVNTSNMGAIGHLVPAAPGAPVACRNESGYARFLDQERYPCQQPPWSELTAVNANTRRHRMDGASRIVPGTGNQGLEHGTPQCRRLYRDGWWDWSLWPQPTTLPVADSIRGRARKCGPPTWGRAATSPSYSSSSSHERTTEP